MLNFLKSFYKIRPFVCKKSKIINKGNQCLLSENIEFWYSDTHSVLDKDTNTVLNMASNINIGDNVWIARDVHFNKNTAIPNNSVVAHHSIITKKFTEPNVIVAGNPATIRKQNITWDLQRPDLYTKLYNINTHKQEALNDEQKR